MKINEVSKQTNMTKRAIKYYEEQGLLKIAKEENGYRCYQLEDVERLKEIGIYRKLGIELKDIKNILHDPAKKQSILEAVYQRKQLAVQKENHTLQQLAYLIEKQSTIDDIYSSLAYDKIANALQDMFPQKSSMLFLYHFLPYLQSPIVSQEQKEAYDTILNFMDDFSIKPTWVMRFEAFINHHLFHQDMKYIIEQIDQKIQDMLHPSPEEYEKIKKQTISAAKLKNRWFFKYHPVFVSQRKFMKRLQDSGYNDIFIPAMTRLSPKYKQYHDALIAMNQRICKDTGLHYDTNYHLILK